MATIIDIYKKATPATGKIDLKGKDIEPIGFENTFKPSKDLSKDAKALKKARGGDLSTKKYSDSVNR